MMEIKKLNELAGIKNSEISEEKSKKLFSYLKEDNKDNTSTWRKKLIEKRSKQEFFLNDIVRYRGNSTSHTGYYYRGKVIEIVKACHYPHSLIRVRGYYKDYITYVIILDSNIRGVKGELRWCSKSRLTLLERKIKGINNKNRK